jgi:acyl carrier protein
MGLDVVELVMRTEEEFGITIDDSSASRIRTVGDLYHAICKLRDVTPHPNPDRLAVSAGLAPSIQTGEGVWFRLVRMIVDQLQVNPGDVRFNSRFLEDLGAD